MDLLQYVDNKLVNTISLNVEDDSKEIDKVEIAVKIGSEYQVSIDTLKIYQDKTSVHTCSNRNLQHIKAT